MVVEAYGKGKLVRRAALSWLELRGSEWHRSVQLNRTTSFYALLLPQHSHQLINDPLKNISPARIQFRPSLVPMDERGRK
jgi:hypothetical protein